MLTPFGPVGWTAWAQPRWWGKAMARVDRTEVRNRGGKRRGKSEAAPRTWWNAASGKGAGEVHPSAGAQVGAQ
ncbi:hypothetical protein GCM10010372_07000 [Streptomyces tauricus]|nr:hypothetical protein GCM10010372_07000 [Streptomyces tauricus]